MSYIKNIMQEEHQRLQALYQKYSDKIDSLPQGTVSIKKRHNSDYLYLACRRDGKVKFDYIGLVGSDNACKVMKQVELRKDFEKKLRQVNSDLKEIEKVIHGRRIRRGRPQQRSSVPGNERRGLYFPNTLTP